MKTASAVRLDCRERAIFEDNIRHAARLGLEMARPGSHDGLSCIIAGSGPSLLAPEALAEIAALRRRPGWVLVALKDAIGILARRGLAADLTVAIDGGAEQVAKIAALQGLTCYLASSCHPALFAHLAGCRRVVFHSVCGFAGEAALYRELFADGTVIAGGITVANRAFALMRFLGFADIVLAGCDFGWRADRFAGYAAGAVGRSKGDGIRLRDHGRTDGKEWFTRPDLLVSAIAMAREIRAGACRAVGDGLAAALARHDEAYLQSLVARCDASGPTGERDMARLRDAV